MKLKMIALLALLPAAACSDTPPKELSADPAAELTLAQPAELVVRAKDFAFDMPDTVTAGAVTIRLVNEGPDFHHLELVRLDGGHTFEELMGVLQQPGTPWPAWAVEVGGPNTPGAPGEATVASMVLEPGSYVAMCVIPGADGAPHIMKGMVKLLTVVPAATPAAPLPAADLVMTLSDYTFEVSAPITAGTRTIRLKNTAAQAHEVVFIKLEKGRTVNEFLGWIQKREGAAPGRIMGGIAGLTPGRTSQVTIEFEPGEYALVCFVPDAKDGQPHIAHGMVKQITID